MEGKKCRDQERLKMSWRKFIPERGRCFSMGQTTMSGPVCRRGEVCISRTKFMERKRRAERRMRLLTARGSVGLGRVASGSATLGLLLGNRKVGSQVVGEDRCRLPGRGTVGVKRPGRGASHKTPERILECRIRFRKDKEMSMSPAMLQSWLCR